MNALVELSHARREVERLPYSVSRENALRLVEAAQRAVEQANGVEQVKEVRDGLAALEAMFKRRGAALEASNLLAAQRILTEREIGRWLDGHVRRGPQSSHDVTNGFSRLPNGIGRMDSTRWQRLAQIDDADLDLYVRECMETQKEITTAGALRLWAMLFRTAANPAVAAQNGDLPSLPTMRLCLVEDWARLGGVLSSMTFDLVIVSLSDMLSVQSMSRLTKAIRSACAQDFHLFWVCERQDAEQVEKAMGLAGLLRSRIIWNWRNLRPEPGVVREAFRPSWKVILHWGNHPLNEPGADDHWLDTWIVARPQNNYTVDPMLVPDQVPIGVLRLMVRAGSGEGGRVLHVGAQGGSAALACPGGRSLVMVVGEDEHAAVIESRFGVERTGG